MNDVLRHILAVIGLCLFMIFLMALREWALNNLNGADKADYANKEVKNNG